MYGTPDDVKSLTGIKPRELGLQEKGDPDGELDTLLTTWLEWVESHIDTRLTSHVEDGDSRYLAIVDISTRTVAKLVSTAIQQRSSPVIRVEDFAVQVLNTRDVTRDLDEELKRFKRASYKLFGSFEDYDDDEG